MIVKALFVALLLPPVAAFAHGDEDHGDAAKLAVVANVAPRAEAHTELFELVATPGNGQLTIFLDRFASNTPVLDAKVEVESGNWKAIAQAAGNGSYRVNAPQFADAGSYPLQFTVQAGTDADLIETTLVVARPAKLAATARPFPAGSFWWGIGGTLALLALTALLLQRRRAGPAL
jgi:hypothetical protein